MSELRKPYVKLWAAEALLSDDLASLTDLEERVYFRLLMVASLEENRWTTRETPGLYRKCMTTGPKFARAVTTLERLGMVERVGDDQLFVVNGPKWNEETDRKKYPSDSPERVRERVTRSRNGGVTSRDGDVKRLHKEKEEEKEQEEEQEKELDAYYGVRIPLPLRDRVIEHCEAIPSRFRDSETVESILQLHSEIPAEQIAAARTAIRRDPKSHIPFAARVRAELPQEKKKGPYYGEEGIFAVND